MPQDSILEPTVEGEMNKSNRKKVVRFLENDLEACAVKEDIQKNTNSISTVKQSQVDFHFCSNIGPSKLPDYQV